MEEVTQISNRYTYYFNDEINPDTVQGLIDTLMGIEEVDLFFSTEGGEISAMGALIHFLNSRHQNIDIYLTESIASAGTFILIDYKGKIFLTEHLDFILFHVADRLSFCTRKEELNKAKLVAQLKTINDDMAAKFKTLGLSDKELAHFRSGKNVILYRKDFKRLNINNN